MPVTLRPALNVPPWAVKFPVDKRLDEDTPANVEVAPVAIMDWPTLRLPVVVMNPVLVIPF